MFRVSSTKQGADCAISTRLEQVESLTRAFESGEYSDLRVSCQGQEWLAHRVILCSRCQFFKSCCENDFKESHSKAIELPEDDPNIVERMLCFLYTSDYPDSGDNSGGAIINILVYAIAEKYGIDTLKMLAKEKFIKVMTETEQFNPDAFASIVSQIYSTPPSSDRGLRDCAKNLMKVHKNPLRGNKAFRGLLQGSVLEGDFILDMVDAWVN